MFERFSSLSSLVGGVAVAGAGFFGGCLYQNAKNDTGMYALQEEKGLVYVVNKDSGERQPLTKSFQMGSPAYRLKGLLTGDDRDIVVNMITNAAQLQLMSEVDTPKKQE
ncbi:MAG: hypothetical protein Q7R96_01620 [Nanoarchaeota archaeon]|nr:hypothetical protein [Nanoarchaeota archaeon]